MNTFRTTAATLITTLILVLMPAPETEAAPLTAPSSAAISPDTAEDVASPAQLTLTNAGPEQKAAVAEAMLHFDAANLELPPLQIAFHDTLEGCGGHQGYYLPGRAQGPTAADKIEICSRSKVILLHELAHAWKHHNLDAETKDEFSALWGLDSWNDSNDAWGDRGIERAAHTIAFTLNQTEPTDSENLLRYICGYELLTGTTLDIHSKVSC